ncbi:MAG: hypothetical protein RLZZ362_977 [Actinomycetota bacterium]
MPQKALTPPSARVNCQVLLGFTDPGSCGRVGLGPAGLGSHSGSAPPACQVVGGAIRVPFGRNVAKVPSASRTTVTWAAYRHRL